MKPAAHKRTAAETPWWLGGEETCLFCWQVYTVETELRCTGCDRGLCAECTVLVHETMDCFCSECSCEEGAG